MTKKGTWKGFDLVRRDSPATEAAAPSVESEPTNANDAAAGAKRGFSLVRDDRQEAPAARPSIARSEAPSLASQLGRMRTRRVMRGPDGEVFDLTEIIPVWLVQLDDINAIFISDSLKSQGYQVKECPRLDGLTNLLKEAEEPPRLIVTEARVVGQQTPFFRKLVLPVLETENIPCLITGVANSSQEQSFRQWYAGPMLVGGDIEEFLASVSSLIGTPGK